MAGDIDLVIESLGSNSFRPLGTAGINTTFYDRAKKVRNLTRTLLSISCGADGDLDPNLKDLLAEIDKATGSNMARLGAICLYGTSNGSGLMLAVAKALQGRQAPKITYIGVGDLTMIPFGRNPPVPGIGDLQPVNAPTISTGLAVVGGVFSRAIPPSVADGVPPRIADPRIDADVRENYFTVQGNRARVFSQSPNGADNWWWTSTQNFGEVHGEIPGWKQIPKTTVDNGSVLARGPGSIDENHHDQLCGLALKLMREEAGIALGNFVTKLK
jgi:hypothetical protein